MLIEGAESTTITSSTTTITQTTSLKKPKPTYDDFLIGPSVGSLIQVEREEEVHASIESSSDIDSPGKPQDRLTPQISPPIRLPQFYVKTSQVVITEENTKSDKTVEMVEKETVCENFTIELETCVESQKEKSGENLEESAKELESALPDNLMLNELGESASVHTIEVEENDTVLIIVQNNIEDTEVNLNKKKLQNACQRIKTHFLSFCE